MSITRIDRKFAALKAEGRAALVTFITAGDPEPETSLAILQALPAAGADVIELGMPFTDPMADGPAIQLSSQRALKSGQTLRRTLDMVRAFRRANNDVPIVLMGYYNPIYIYGVDRFLRDANDAGVDGQDLNPDERHARVDVDHDAAVEDQLEDLGERAAGGAGARSRDGHGHSSVDAGARA